MLRFFNGRPAIAAGMALAKFASERISADASPGGYAASPEAHLWRDFSSEIDRQLRPLKLNVLQRGRLVRAFRSGLLRAGVAEQVARRLCRELIGNLSTDDGNGAAAPDVPKAGADAREQARSVQEILARADEHAARGEHERAIAAYRQLIAVDPQNALGFHNLALVLCASGRFRVAEDHLRRAIALDPQFGEAHYHLGVVLRVLGRLARAEQSMRRALELDPSRLEFKVGLAETLSLLGQTPEADGYLREVLKLSPGHQGASVALGQLSRLEGRFEDAEKLFRKALAEDPNQPTVWAALVRLRKMTDADVGWLRSVQDLLERPLIPSAEAELRFAVGKYWDDLKDYQQAFDSYKRANEAIRSGTVGYNRAARAAYVDDMIRIYTKETLTQITDGASPSATPIFVVGMPRSGTSLVEQIIASHSRAIGAGELGFWTEVLIEHARLIRADVLSGVIRQKLAEAYTDLLTEHSIDALRIVDKAPVNAEYLGFIHSIFPNARVIYMRRDPIDTCLSCYFQYLSPALSYTMDLSDLAHYYREHHRLMAHWRTVLPPSTILDVPYEELVGEPEMWARRIVGFVGLEWQEQCLQFYTTKRVVATSSNWQVRQKIYTDSRGRWRNYAPFIEPLLDLVRLSG